MAVITSTDKQNQMFAPTVKKCKSRDVWWLPHLAFIYPSRTCGSQNNIFIFILALVETMAQTSDLDRCWQGLAAFGEKQSSYFSAFVPQKS